MKRTIAMILAVLMILTLAACSAKKDEGFKRGALEMEGEDLFSSEEHRAHLNDEYGHPSDFKAERICYNNLSSALLDLESRKINALALTECIANYVTAHNDKITMEKVGGTLKSFSMMISDSNTEVYDILNNAIVELKTDGTLDNLVANELKAYTNTDPEAKELPHFDGAKTIKIAVTGDLPPMDFVTAYGKAAGFNIALLTEIANRAQVNFELVQIETGARAIALSSGKVDAVFWTRSTECTTCGAKSSKNINGVLVTESYFTDYGASLLLKSGK